MRLALYRKRWDWMITLSALCLVLIGAVSIYSATQVHLGGHSGYFSRHLVYLGLASVVFLVFLFLPLRLWEDWSYLVFGLAIVCLIIVLAFGVESHGARRWFQLAGTRFQPSEFAKLAFIAALARYLAGKRLDPTRIGSLASIFGLLALPTVLVLKQPDLGTAAAFPALALPMLIFAGVPRVLLFVIVSPILGFLLLKSMVLWSIFLVVSVFIFWRSRLSVVWLVLFLALHVTLHVGAPHAIQTLHPYQQARINTFFDPGADPSGSGYQVLQSKIAIGSGQMFGKGYLQGSQKALAFLPQQHTDFIFSVLGEEWGFFGGALVVFLFGLLVFRSIQVGVHHRNPFASLLAVGIAGLLVYHAAVNMAMTMGLFPVTGLPLPMLSYGGSFLLTIAASVGLLANVAVHRYDH